MQRTRSHVLAAAALTLGLGAMPITTVADRDVTTVRDSTQHTKAVRGLAGLSGVAAAAQAISGGYHGQVWWRHPRPGYTVRQGQRMARKRRNQLRARRAGRG